MDRVPGRPGVVIRSRVGRGAVVADPAVTVTGQGEEHRGPVALPVRRGVHPAGGTRGDLAGGQRGGVLAAPGGPGPAGALPVAAAVAGGNFAADPGPGDLGIELADQFVIAGGVLPGGRGGVAAQLSLGAHGQPELLQLIGRGRAQVRLVLQVPALPALHRPQRLRPLRTRRADAGQSRPARHHQRRGLSRLGVSATQLHRPQTPAASLGDLPDRVTSQRVGGTIGAGLAAGHKWATPCFRLPSGD